MDSSAINDVKGTEKMVWFLIEKYAFFKDADWKEEMFQECTCMALELSGQYNPERGKLSTFLYTSYKGRILNTVYRDRHLSIEEIDPLDYVENQDLNIVKEEEKMLINKDFIDNLEKSLEPEDFFLIKSYYGEGLTLETLGSILKMTHQGVRARIMRLMIKIRRKYAK